MDIPVGKQSQNVWILKRQTGQIALPPKHPSNILIESEPKQKNLQQKTRVCRKDFFTAHTAVNGKFPEKKPTAAFPTFGVKVLGRDTSPWPGPAVFIW